MLLLLDCLPAQPRGGPAVACVNSTRRRLARSLCEQEATKAGNKIKESAEAKSAKLLQDGQKQAAAATKSVEGKIKNLLRDADALEKQYK
eukprot:6179539-Pleurochrysis_carterae.AAC.3